MEIIARPPAMRALTRPRRTSGADVARSSSDIFFMFTFGWAVMIRTQHRYSRVNAPASLSRLCRKSQSAQRARTVLRVKSQSAARRAEANWETCCSLSSFEARRERTLVREMEEQAYMTIRNRPRQGYCMGMKSKGSRATSLPNMNTSRLPIGMQAFTRSWCCVLSVEAR